jgi:ELWxxDGT repeat protein
VKDIAPGPSGSSPRAIADFNGVAVFAADDGQHGTELWRSDGTEAGTWLLSDLNPGPASSGAYWYFAVLSDMLFFNADDGTHGQELWRTDGTPDGTPGGTLMVRDIFTGTNGSAPLYLVMVNDLIFMSANDGANGRELWTSDGTHDGTTLVSAASTRLGGGMPSFLAALASRVIYAYDDGVHGIEPWESAGTAIGTRMVWDIWPGENSGYPGPPVRAGELAYFGANDGVHGIELWAAGDHHPVFAPLVVRGDAP